MNCKYDKTYSFPSLPVVSSIPNGKVVSIGWTDFCNGENIVYGYENNTTIIRDENGNVQNINLPNTTFKNLTSSNGASLNYYFDTFPILYRVYYNSYLRGSLETLTTSVQYRFCNKSIFTLKNLPTPSTGYKLTNQMKEMNGMADSSIKNNWFTSSEHMAPGSPTITTIDIDYAGDYNVYSYETANQYFVKFYDYLNNKTEEVITMICETGNLYNYPNVPGIETELPIGEAAPLGWTSFYNDNSHINGIQYNTNEVGYASGTFWYITS